jgi:LuxR family maltose regulon positive regulatory protein
MLEYLNRPRVHQLLADAIHHRITIVCAGAGCGKTRAVSDFTGISPHPSVWIQFSERDNNGSRFWAKYTQLASGWDGAFVAHCQSLGFPDTPDKINMHITMRRRYAPQNKRIVVLDDTHLITHPDILLFLEQGILKAEDNTSFIIICREIPPLHLDGLRLRGLIPTVTEDDLTFTESELALYLRQLSLAASEENRRRILEDTRGWAFAVNLIARSLRKTPQYRGYVRDAMKQNICKLMENEVFNAVSVRLQRLLIKLSLIDHLSAGFIAELTAGETGLLEELNAQNAYIRFDHDINAYLIHDLFLEFLHTKEYLLTPEEVSETYRAAARWCVRHGFEIDALVYLEKTGGYAEIAEILTGLPVQMSYDIALRAAGIFERAPAEVFGRILNFAVMHIRVVVCLGRWGEAINLTHKYKAQFLTLSEGDVFRYKTLGGIYFTWGFMRALMSTADHRYDCDVYYAKADECLTKAPVPPDQYADMPIGFWAGLAGSSQKGAPQAYIASAVRAVQYITHFWPGATRGLDILCQGELLFYQGRHIPAETHFWESFRLAAEKSEVQHKSLFYLMRLALLQGNRKKAEQALAEMDANRTYGHGYETAVAWYYFALRCPEMIPAWLKEKFTDYRHAYFIENTGNQIKARYHYQTRNYPPLLAYIAEMKRRESILYGRIEMLAMEACCHFQMKDKPGAFRALRLAYEEAHPNEIITPFAELGRDMRTLTAAALRETAAGIPAEWLETVRRKSASYAKYQSVMVTRAAKANGGRTGIPLSVREREILNGLYAGLSRPEIAVKLTLSINTVNSTVTNIYNKLGAGSIADVIRIAAEEMLV